MTDLMQRLDELATASDAPDNLTRLFLSPAHKRAIGLVTGWMQQAGLHTEIDAIGNLVGRTANPSGSKILLLGSHIDTVRNAGKYDGNFGVLAAIAALSQAGPLPYGVEIIAFGDEEGVRFAQTLSGSRAVAGTFAAAALEGCDVNGISMTAALRDFGCNPADIHAIVRDPAKIAAYIELHIEQGPVLESHNLPVGIVTAINGASRYAATVTGRVGHAGTVPMAMRRDALTAAAEMVLAIEAAGRAAPDLVATVGTLSLQPGAPNSVPGQVNFSIDIRAPSDDVRITAATSITAALERLAASRRVDLDIIQTHDAPATPCALALREQLAAAITAQSITPFNLPSGAGHDAMAIAALCPVGMLFVRCKAGISHTPEESITAEDANTAVAVLAEFLRRFQPE